MGQKLEPEFNSFVKQVDSKPNLPGWVFGSCQKLTPLLVAGRESYLVRDVLLVPYYVFP